MPDKDTLRAERTRPRETHVKPIVKSSFSITSTFIQVVTELDNFSKYNEILGFHIYLHAIL